MNSPHFQPGDLLAFHGRGLTSAIINAFTWGWPFRRPARWAGISHVAVVGFHPHDMQAAALYESTTGSTLPCLYSGWPVSGVQCHRIEERLAEYEGLVWHYPLTAAAREFYNEEAGQSFLWAACYRPYDWHQALAARATPLGWLCRKLCRHNAAAAYYCSELVAGAWHAGFGNWPELQQNPNRLLRRARRMVAVGEGVRLK